MSKFKLREQFANTFETALENAGMQSPYADGDLPKYWRGDVLNDRADIYLNYSVSEPQDLESADDKLFRQQLFIDGKLFTRSGYGDSNFQDLAEEIEEECKKLNIFISWTGEGKYDDLDTESPQFYVNFEAQIRLRNN